MKFKHREHVISVRRDGSFMAEGGNIEGRSLEAVKRKLDDKYNAKPFKALRLAWFRSGPIQRVTVVGMRRRHRHGTYTEFVLADGNTARELYADTPENRRVLRAAITLRQKNGRQRTKMDLAERSALNKAARVSAE